MGRRRTQRLCERTSAQGAEGFSWKRSPRDGLLGRNVLLCSVESRGRLIFTVLGSEQADTLYQKHEGFSVPSRSDTLFS